MTKPIYQTYRFATEEQWQKCLLAGTNMQSLHSNHVVQPLAPFEPSATSFPSVGACAPAVKTTGEILWLDQAGNLHRLAPGDDFPEIGPAPFAMPTQSRLVATQDLWTIGTARRSIQRYDSETLTRLLTVELPPDTNVLDIARGPRGNVFALVEHTSSGGTTRWAVQQIDSAGHQISSLALTGFSQATGLVYLSQSNRFVVLTGETHPRLCWFAAEGGAPVFAKLVSAIRPCFVTTVLGSDSRERIFLAGSDGSFAGIVVLNADGEMIDSVPVDSGNLPMTGIAARGDTLALTGSKGLLRFGIATVIPGSAGHAGCALITPMLFSPDRDGARGWLRMEVVGNFPEGSTLEIAIAAVADEQEDLRDSFNKIASDESLPAARRIQALLALPDIWRTKTVFHGSSEQADHSAIPLSAPLFDIREHYLWGYVSLTAAPDASLPSISEIRVIYPERSLMQELPAIFRRDPSPNFLRSLVGVLEAGTQELDNRIAKMSALLRADTAPDAWLNFVARWTGIPWDDALGIAQKRCLLKHAAGLARDRGTRSGLETLLRCLIPGSGSRFRITDATADFGFALVGSSTCPGSALPAILGGATRWNSALDMNAVLGYTLLPCDGFIDDPAARFASRIRIEIAATAEERRQWEPWLRTLILEMVPLTSPIQLLWVPASVLSSQELDGTLSLEPVPWAHLGTDAITGLAQLPEGRIRLSSCGPEINTRLS
jgi:phage tail-like protein